MPKPPKPLILISGSTDDKGAEFVDYSMSLSMNYPLALTAAGGLPWLLPCQPDRDLVAEAVRRSDGVLLTGGDDVDPKLYTKRLPPDVAKTVQRAHADRDSFEILLINEVLRQRKALLCICRGHQILNVALGGTLIADIALQIPRALNHSRTDRKDRVVHEVVCEAGSLMARIAGKEQLGVNSSHHQAVDRVAQSLRPTGVSRDGVVESLELAASANGLLPYLLAVQFHPERLFGRHAEHLELFKTFIRACRQRGRRS
jgi:putative glutamine amidotransferase